LRAGATSFSLKRLARATGGQGETQTAGRSRGCALMAKFNSTLFGFNVIPGSTRQRHDAIGAFHQLAAECSIGADDDQLGRLAGGGKIVCSRS